MTRALEIYDINATAALGAEPNHCYGRADNADDAIAYYKAAQSRKTLASGYVFKAEIVNGVWAVSMTEGA